MSYLQRQREGLDRQAVELKPDWPKGYTRVGAAAFHLRDWETATKAYEKGARRTCPTHRPFALLGTVIIPFTGLTALQFQAKGSVDEPLS